MNFRIFNISYFHDLFLSIRHLPTNRNETISFRLKSIATCVLFIFLLCLPQGCNARKEVVLTGRTMGTTYHIKAVTGYLKRTSGLKDEIDVRLQAINQSMSTFIDNSEISRFNRWSDISTSCQVGHDFFQVFKKAQQLHALTGGAWDGTVKPLVDLWGFGKPAQQSEPPDAGTIEQLLNKTGFDQIQVPDEGHVLKTHADLTLDFASIAKGYAVDQVSLLLRSQGITDFIVEIGGEVFAAGVRQDGMEWRVGVNMPDKNASFYDLYSVVQLSNLAMATSGDYRNFIERDGVMYSHIIDPRTGYPVQNNVASVTIIAPDCTMADGLATAIVVMGVEKGKALLETLPNVEGLIIVRDPGGKLSDFPSAGFAAFSE